MKQTSGPRLSSRLYEELRRGIITGVYPQGQRLTEQSLAAELGVSRIPLREALPQLEVEGFIQSFPRRGVVVSRWTDEAVHHVFDVRIAIEGQAARLAARRAADGKAELDRLWERLEESEAQIRAGDALAVAQANADFHQEVVAATGNALMTSLMAAVAGRLVWMFYLSIRSDPKSPSPEHRTVTQAIADGNELLAESIMLAHIESGREPALQMLRESRPDA
ncbi:GntR family transcriptional regulator [Kribbella sp. NPDC059898]|uniref:GntR family transcriptional regulator n=1 Tax=Kribbella sp. NPDC059898 TaxID=3346995 RepID=UPI003652EC6F